MTETETRQEIMELILDRSITGVNLIKEVEKLLKNIVPYKHEEEDIQKAINIDFPRAIHLDKNDAFSEKVEEIEDQLCKRQLSLMVLTELEEKRSRQLGDEQHLSVKKIMGEEVKDLYYEAKRLGRTDEFDPKSPEFNNFLKEIIESKIDACTEVDASKCPMCSLKSFCKRFQN